MKPAKFPFPVLLAHGVDGNRAINSKPLKFPTPPQNSTGIFSCHFSVRSSVGEENSNKVIDMICIVISNMHYKIQRAM